jgi:hypothetical protein
MVSLEFFIDRILPFALWSWGWFSLQKKWVPGIFPGGKDGWCVGLTTLPPSCADFLEIWEPAPPGTLWGCPGLYTDCFTLLLCFKIFGSLSYVVRVVLSLHALCDCQRGENVNSDNTFVSALLSTVRCAQFKIVGAKSNFQAPRNILWTYSH